MERSKNLLGLGDNLDYEIRIEEWFFSRKNKGINRSWKILHNKRNNSDREVSDYVEFTVVEISSFDAAWWPRKKENGVPLIRV